MTELANHGLVAGAQSLDHAIPRWVLVGHRSIPCCKSIAVVSQQATTLHRGNQNGGWSVPLYKYLTAKETGPKFAGEIKWNFTKFLIGRSDKVVARFEPGVEPQSEKVVQAIEVDLTKK